MRPAPAPAPAPSPVAAPARNQGALFCCGRHVGCNGCTASRLGCARVCCDPVDDNKFAKESGFHILPALWCRCPPVRVLVLLQDTCWSCTRSGATRATRRTSRPSGSRLPAPPPGWSTTPHRTASASSPLAPTPHTTCVVPTHSGHRWCLLVLSGFVCASHCARNLS